MYSVWIAIGGIVASVIDNATAYMPGRRCYYIPLSIGFIVPVVCWVLLWFIPESPRWLVNRDQFDQAEKALRRLRPKNTPEEVILGEMADMKEAHSVEMELKKSAAVFDLFRGSVNRVLLPPWNVANLVATNHNLGPCPSLATCHRRFIHAWIRCLLL